MGVFLGIILSTTVFVAVFLMVASASPDGMSLWRAWNGGDYAEIPPEVEVASVGLPARVPLDPLITMEGPGLEGPGLAPPLTGTAAGAGSAPDVAGALAPHGSEDGTRAATLLDGTGADAGGPLAAGQAANSLPSAAPVATNNADGYLPGYMLRAVP